MMMTTPRTVAVDAALAAGRIQRRHFGRLDGFELKREIDLVTVADMESERAVIEKIRAAFPDHAILAEESGAHEGADGARARWHIDPLDGTTNFAHSYPPFCVSIGFEVDGHLHLGVVYVPLLDELFIAERGQGATLNGVPIRVSSTDSLARSQLSTGFQYDLAVRSTNLDAFGRFTLATQAVRVDGSAAIDLCYVACGRFDGYWEAGIEPWDSAAAAVIVREAGGRLTDFSGGAFSLRGQTVLASNGLIHDDMIEILSERSREAM
jgi:myo-inositol-1(or 4)-monophosphatase